MIFKPLLALFITVSACAAIAQDTEDRTELPESCVKATTVISKESTSSTVFVLEIDCQLYNYAFSVVNSDGEMVFESKSPFANWTISDAPSGFYTWKLLGTIGDGLEIQNVQKIGVVEITK